MSADLSIARSACSSCGRSGDMPDDDLNVTYNLSSMLEAAGFHGWRWCEGKRAVVVGAHMLEVLDRMDENPDRWRALNPPNGWGDYDKCIQGRMRTWASLAITAGPEAKVSTWL